MRAAGDDGCACIFRSSCPAASSLSISADILCFPDPTMPRIQADTVNQKRLKVTRADVLAAKRAYPDYNRYQLADLLGVSEQTVQRRLEHNNVRGASMRPKPESGSLAAWSSSGGRRPASTSTTAGYGPRTPAWENGRWAQ